MSSYTLYTLVLNTLVQNCYMTILVICFIGERGGGSNILTGEITLPCKSIGCWELRFCFLGFGVVKAISECCRLGRHMVITKSNQ